MFSGCGCGGGGGGGGGGGVSTPPNQLTLILKDPVYSLHTLAGYH